MTEDHAIEEQLRLLTLDYKLKELREQCLHHIRFRLLIIPLLLLVLCGGSLLVLFLFGLQRQHADLFSRLSLTALCAFAIVFGIFYLMHRVHQVFEKTDLIVLKEIPPEYDAILLVSIEDGSVIDNSDRLLPFLIERQRAET